MALTSDGLVIKRFDELFTEINDNLDALEGKKVDSSQNSFIGNFHANFSTSLAELYELAQAIYDSQNLYNAEGESLDNLALLLGMLRNPAKRSTGVINYTGADGVFIERGTEISSVRDDSFFAANDFTIISTSCLDARVYIAVLANNEDYRVSINDTLYSYISDTDATEEEILNNLKTLMDSDGRVTNTVVVDLDDPTQTYLSIVKDDQTSTMALKSTTYLKFDYVTTPARADSTQFGAVPGDALSIINQVSAVTNLYSIINPSDFTLGRDKEDDDDFRTRILTGFDTVGAGTPDSIANKVSRVDDVAAAIVIENTGVATDGDGIPPKSYEVIVHEGLNSDIALAIWETKPAGIFVHGSVQETIKDFNDYDQTVRFSRPSEKFVFIYVTYSLYGEEEFPVSAEDDVKQAMLVLGDSLSIDKDIIAKRFLTPIYGTSTGFGDITIEIAYTDSPVTIPAYPADYVETTLAISKRQISSFALDRMTFVQV